MVDLWLNLPYVTIHNQDTLLVTSRQGWIGEGRTGLYHRDTRYLSSYRLTLNGFEPVFLGASRPSYFAAAFYYTNPPLGAEPSLIPENSLLLKVSRYVRDGVHEDIALTNHAGKRVAVLLELHLDSDFSDIFQVRGLEWIVPRLSDLHWDNERLALTFRYQRDDFRRTLRFQFHPSTGQSTHGMRSKIFRLELAPHETWRTCVAITFDDRPAPAHPDRETFASAAHELEQWRASVTHLETATDSVRRIYQQAVADVAALRLEKVNGHWFPAAGVPWYTAVFGRDGLVTALQALTVHHPFAIGVLDRLAQLQGQTVNHWTEEEPGKLPHELRHGELAATGKIPHVPYYGAVDTPLLYVILLDELYRFTADRSVLRRFHDPAVACLTWAERYGDFDGDGFIEYRPLSPKGYRHQAWKDAHDAIVYPDGSQVDPPITICEVQGYYYDALCRMVEIARLESQPDASETYASRAATLYDRFNEVFWLEDEGTYALGLDARKEPIKTVASNPGHLLWSGIVPPDRAERVVRRLLAEDMFAGWGIRTLSADNPSYDPISYQCGSIWPHDNAIIALGMKRYGYWREVNQIAEGIFAAAACYEQFSLPELFGGLDRGPEEPPAPYIEANVPQAWAAGSVFMLLRAILGLEPDPHRHCLSVAPCLPEWLLELTLRGLAVFGEQLDLRFVGVGPETTVEVLRQSGPVEVERRRMG